LDEVPNESPYSIEVSCTVADFIPPSVPTGLNVEAIPAGSALYISWEANPEPDFAWYRLYMATGIALAEIENIDLYTLDVELPAGTTSYLHEGLVNGQTYYYRISAVDDAGNPSELSAPVSGIPQDTLAPATPIGLTVTAIPDGGTLELKWDANVVDEDLAGYIIYWSEVEAPEDTYEPLETVSASITNYTHHGLIDGKRYYYRISAIDNAVPVPNESGKSAPVSGVPKDIVAPSTPTGLEVTALPSMPNTLKISWNANLEPDLVCYRLYYNTVDLDTSYKLVAELPAGTTKYYHENLTADLTYYYKITAVDDGMPNPNESPRSSAVSAVPYSPEEAAELVEDEEAPDKRRVVPREEGAISPAVWVALIVIIVVGVLIAFILIRRRKKAMEAAVEPTVLPVAPPTPFPPFPRPSLPPPPLPPRPEPQPPYYALPPAPPQLPPHQPELYYATKEPEYDAGEHPYLERTPPPPLPPSTEDVLEEIFGDIEKQQDLVGRGEDKDESRGAVANSETASKPTEVQCYKCNNMITVPPDVVSPATVTCPHCGTASVLEF
jgi:fibronectin type 3 domain-containing protein/ribosomal protein S27E